MEFEIFGGKVFGWATRQSAVLKGGPSASVMDVRLSLQSTPLSPGSQLTSGKRWDRGRDHIPV